ncbi:hypothetical protein ABK040_000407 [Willaertia magna]
MSKNKKSEKKPNKEEDEIEVEEAEEEEENSNHLRYDIPTIELAFSQIKDSSVDYYNNELLKTITSDTSDEMIDLKDRIKGSILGHAYGDVIGCPMEGWKVGVIKKFYCNGSNQLFDFGLLLQRGFPSEAVLKSKNLTNIPTKLVKQKNNEKSESSKKKGNDCSSAEAFLRHIRPLGLHSDDTQQGFALMNSILEFTNICQQNLNSNNNISLETNEKTFLDCWSKWMKEGFNEGDCYSLVKGNNEEKIIVGKNIRAFRDFGSNTSKSLKRLCYYKKNACESGSTSNGIGGMMRCVIAPTCFVLSKYANDIIKYCDKIERNDNEDNLFTSNIIRMLFKFSYEQCLTTHSTFEAATVTFASNLIAFKFIEMGNKEETIHWILENVPDYLKVAEKCLWKDKLKWKTLGEPLDDSIHTTSNVLEELFEFIKENRKEVTLLKEVREKISNLAKKAKKKSMKGHVNQGFCLLGGVHAICVSLMPDNPDIVYYSHPSPMSRHMYKKNNSSDEDIEDKQYVNKTKGDNHIAELLLDSIITLGYDVDTVGAIAGYLLGSRFGTKWMKYLNQLVDLKRIDKYSEHLIGILTDSNGDISTVETVDEYINHEKLLTLYSRIQRHKLLDEYVPMRRQEGDELIISKRLEFHSLH